MPLHDMSCNMICKVSRYKLDTSSIVYVLLSCLASNVADNYALAYHFSLEDDSSDDQDSNIGHRCMNPVFLL